MRLEQLYNNAVSGINPVFPAASFLRTAEIALNTHKGTESIFFKNDNNEVVRFKLLPDWTDITSKPTTLSGYGITDAALSGHTHLYAGSASAGGAANSTKILDIDYRLTYNWSGVNYFNISTTAGNAAGVNDTPTTAWWHIMRYNHANAAGYYTDLAIPFNNDSIYWKRIEAGAVKNGGWVKVWDALNSNLTTIDWKAKNLTLAGAITGATSLSLSSTLAVTGASTFTGLINPNGGITGISNKINTIYNNLGDPTVAETAIIHGQFTNKLRFISPLLQEESTDGTTWITSTRASAAVLGDMMRGEGEGSNFNAIPAMTVGGKGYYRLTWEATQTGYVFLNQLYVYCSTNGQNVNFKIEQYHNTNGWSDVCNGITSNWPGHVTIKHDRVAFSTNAAQYGKIRLTLSVASASNTNAVTLNNIEWFGGYPSGRRNVESYDRLKNVTFPNAITGTSFIKSGGTAAQVLLANGTTANLSTGNSYTLAGISNSIPFIDAAGVMEVGKFIDFHDSATSTDYACRLISESGYLKVGNAKLWITDTSASSLLVNGGITLGGATLYSDTTMDCFGLISDYGVGISNGLGAYIKVTDESMIEMQGLGLDVYMDANILGHLTSNSFATPSCNIGTWNVTEVSGELVFKKSGAIIAKLNSLGIVSMGGLTSLG